MTARTGTAAQNAQSVRRIKVRATMQIQKQTKESIRRMIPKGHARAAGIGPYFIPLFGRLYYQRLERVLQLTNNELPEPAGHIADFGCGFGVLVALLGKTYDDVVGIDTYPTSVLKVAEDVCVALSSRKSCSFLRGDISHLAFQTDVFQASFCLDVLEHVSDVEGCLQEMQRVLKAGALLYVTVPVEGKLLRAAREIILLHGRRGEVSPHWHGSITNYKQFEECLSKYFQISKKEYVPNKLFPYDVLYCCKK
jgi:ubiquinone/menaquinone biosynthesis C-methylase UbiE